MHPQTLPIQMYALHAGPIATLLIKQYRRTHLPSGKFAPRQSGVVRLKHAVAHLDVRDGELVEAVRHHVLRLPVGAVTNAGHQPLTFEPSPHTIVDALRLSPVALQDRTVSNS